MSYKFSWVKPSNVSYPSVWHRFQAKGLEGEDLIWYRIEDIPEERFEEAVQFMVENYTDEPFFACRGGETDEIALADLAGMWRGVLPQKMSYACVRDDTGEFAGMNAVSVLRKEDNFSEQLLGSFKAKSNLELSECINTVYGDLDVFKKYNVDHYMTGNGLVVSKKYRCRGVGVELLKARKPVCLAHGVTVTNTSFPSHLSSACATKAGFTMEKSMTYEELQKIHPNIDFPPCSSPRMDIQSWKF